MTHTHNALTAGLLFATGRTCYNGQEYSTPSGAAKATGSPWVILHNFEVPNMRRGDIDLLLAGPGGF